MNTTRLFVRIRALAAVAGVMLVGDAVQAALTTAKGTGQDQGAAVWLCLAAFVLGTLGLAFWNSKRREAE
jgi:hypothetical protein